MLPGHIYIEHSDHGDGRIHSSLSCRLCGTRYRLPSVMSDMKTLDQWLQLHTGCAAANSSPAMYVPSRAQRAILSGSKPIDVSGTFPSGSYKGGWPEPPTTPADGYDESIAYGEPMTAVERARLQVREYYEQRTTAEYEGRYDEAEHWSRLIWDQERAIRQAEVKQAQYDHLTCTPNPPIWIHRDQMGSF